MKKYQVNEHKENLARRQKDEKSQESILHLFSGWDFPSECLFLFFQLPLLSPYWPQVAFRDIHAYIVTYTCLWRAVYYSLGYNFKNNGYIKANKAHKLEQCHVGRFPNSGVGIGSQVQNVDRSILTSNPDTESHPVGLEKASLPLYLHPPAHVMYSGLCAQALWLCALPPQLWGSEEWNHPQGV